MDEVDAIPDDAMSVSGTTNHVRFSVTDVIEWYTVKSDGSIVRERFIAEEPAYPEDIPIGLGKDQ